MYKRSIEDPAGFWSDIASSEFYWKQRWGYHVYSENLDVRKGNIKIEVFFSLLFPCFFLFNIWVNASVITFFLSGPYQWFKGGITNMCYNCLDRNIDAGLADKIALYWESNEPGFDATLTYCQLLHRVCQVSSTLY